MLLLLIIIGDKWGALGLSRKNTLMDKEFKFETFSSLVADFKSCYEECGHKLTAVSIGLPFSHSSMITSKINYI